MEIGCPKPNDSVADVAKRPVEAEQMLASGSRNDLQKKVEELTLKLTIANEALKVESDRCKLAEEALKESEKKYHQVKVEYNEIILNMKRQMEQALQMEELGKVLAPALAHDLKNLITTISSLAQLSIEKHKLRPPLNRHLRIIYGTSQKANRLIRGFLDFAKIFKHNELNYEPIDIHDIIDRMWRMVELNIGPRQVSFVPRWDRNLSPLMGDIEKMERLFLNLLLNAAQAIPKKGRIIAQTRLLPSKNMVEVNIVDNGMGISKEYCKKLFEPFSTTKEGGTGLGLSICQAIIQQHQGSITIKSQKNRGTKVSVRLPITLKQP